MNREEQSIFDALKARERELPNGWSVEKEFGYNRATHLVAPKRMGGVIVKWCTVIVQLPGVGPARDTIDCGRIVGRNWLQRLCDAAITAAKTYAHVFRVA